jgi:hypothetical protein
VADEDGGCFEEHQVPGSSAAPVRLLREALVITEGLSRVSPSMV